MADGASAAVLYAAGFSLILQINPLFRSTKAGQAKRGRAAKGDPGRHFRCRRRLTEAEPARWIAA